MNECNPGSVPPESGRRGAKDIFDELFQTYYARLSYFAFQLVRDKSVAEDICQEVFMRFWKNGMRIEGGEKAIKSYLYTAVQNLGLSLLRRNKVAARYIDQYEPVTIEEAHITASLIRTEVIAEVNRALDSLPQGCRNVIRLAYIEGLRNADIASELGLSLNTVKTQRQRGMKLLRSRVRPEILRSLLIF